jgi:hypothetical protein
MTLFNDNEMVRKLESNLNRHNAYHPTTKKPITSEDNYHTNAFNQAYLKYLQGHTIKACVTDLAHVLLECNTHLSREYEPRDVSINRAFELCFPEFKAFVDFRNDLPEGEDFEMDFE